MVDPVDGTGTLVVPVTLVVNAGLNNIKYMMPRNGDNSDPGHLTSLGM